MESHDSPEFVPENGRSPSRGKSSDRMSNDGMWPEYCNPAYRMPNQIEVKATVASGEYFFPVTIIKFQSVKPYLGGYRHKNNGRIYHHANTQTPPDAKKTVKDTSNLRSRDTQTSEHTTRSIQSYRESGTQMERIDLCLDNKRDIVLIPRIYFSSAELLLLQKKKTIEIQRCWRGYVARCLATRMRWRNIEIDRQQDEEREAEMKIKQAERHAELERRAHPKDNADFAVLYNELTAWRKGEVIKIKAAFGPGEERVAAMSQLLENETKALQAIQRMKISAHKDMYTEKTTQMLEMMSRPQRWQLSTGEVCQVQTQASVRAKELLDLYNALGAAVNSVEERLDILLHIKWTVREFDSQLTRDISELVDREADLLNRGRPIKNMQGLRVRLGNLFLRFLEDPMYNPRATEFTNIVKASSVSSED